MDAGGLVSDDLIIDLVKERIAQPDCANGCIFDGFPRTIPQAQALADAGVHIDHVIEISAPDADIISRLSGRRSHPASGRIYHTTYNPPKVEGKDDMTGEDLVQRDDDKESVIRDRLVTYHNQTEALVGFYQNQANSADNAQIQTKYAKFDGTQAIDKITQDILTQLHT